MTTYMIPCTDGQTGLAASVILYGQEVGGIGRVTSICIGRAEWRQLIALLQQLLVAPPQNGRGFVVQWPLPDKP